MTVNFWSFLILLPPHLQCRDYRPALPYPVNLVCRISPRALGTLGKHLSELHLQPLLQFLSVLFAISLWDKSSSCMYVYKFSLCQNCVWHLHRGGEMVPWPGACPAPPGDPRRVPSSTQLLQFWLPEISLSLASSDTVAHVQTHMQIHMIKNKNKTAFINFILLNL